MNFFNVLFFLTTILVFAWFSYHGMTEEAFRAWMQQSFWHFVIFLFGGMAWFGAMLGIGCIRL